MVIVLSTMGQESYVIPFIMYLGRGKQEQKSLLSKLRCQNALHLVSLPFSSWLWNLHLCWRFSAHFLCKNVLFFSDARQLQNSAETPGEIGKGRKLPCTSVGAFGSVACWSRYLWQLPRNSMSRAVDYACHSTEWTIKRKLSFPVLREPKQQSWFSIASGVARE